MIINFDSALFIIMFLMLGTIAGLLYRSYQKTKSPAVQSLFYTFLFATLYALTLAAFSVGAAGRPFILAIGYNLAILLVFLAIYFVIRIPIFAENDFIKKNYKIISALVAIVGIIVLAIQLIDLRLPIENSRGIIFWNANPVAAWATSFMVLGYALVLAWLTYKNIAIMTDRYQRWKLNALILVFVGIGVSSFLFFPSHNETQSLISFLAILPGYIYTIIVFSYLKLKGV